MLILKLVSFPYSLDTDAEQNYIQLPGGKLWKNLIGLEEAWFAGAAGTWLVTATHLK